MASCKLLIIGHARHGKDTVAEWITRNTPMRFVSSSEYACKHVVWPVLAPQYGYATMQECFEDRAAHREEWFNIIGQYNKDDKARLAKEILSEVDMYVGMRALEEFKAAEPLFNAIIWVDASKRQPAESVQSCQLTLPIVQQNTTRTVLVIDNNGSVDDLHAQLTEKLRPYVIKHATK